MAKTIWYETKMTSNTAPSPYVVSASTEYSGMEAWKAFNGTVADNDDRWRSTTKTDSWIKLDFGESKKVSIVKITAVNYSTVIGGHPITFTIEGSSDDVNWNTIKQFTTTAFSAGESRDFEFDRPVVYRYFRLTPTETQGSTSYYNIGEISYGLSPINKILISSDDEYYSIEPVGREGSLIPAMTSNTAPKGVASASSVYSSSYPAWKAFDGRDVSDGWASSGTTFPQWLKYDFGEPETVGKYTIRGRNSTNADDLRQTIKDWEFQGSNDDVNWTTLDKRVGEANWNRSEKREYEFKNTTAYRYYRVFITAHNGSTVATAIGEMEMFEAKFLRLKLVSMLTEDSFLVYGMDKNTNINLENDVASVTNIVDKSETLGSGKVFKQKIDTTKSPIKNLRII